MARPGVIFTESTAPDSRGASTDTGTLFLVGETASGTANTPVLIQSIGDYTTTFGARTGSAVTTYDFLDVFFRTGGSRAYVVKAAGVTTQNRTDALAAFSKTLGPGRVAIAGTNDITSAGLIGQHAVDNGRIAFHSISGITSALITAANAVTALGDAIASHTALFAGSVIVPFTGGTTRTVPLSAAQAGTEARRDRLGNVGRVAAFTDWEYPYVTDLAQTFTDADIQTLVVSNGVNVAANQYGALALKSYVTAEARANGVYWGLQAANVRMAIQAEAERIAYSFLGEVVDGQGQALGALEGALKGMLMRHYSDGNLFGATASDAFVVVCDFGNNPPDQLAAGNVTASLNVRLSPYAEFVTIDLVTTPITETLSV